MNIFNFMIQAGFMFARLILASIICFIGVSILYHVATFCIFWLAEHWPAGL